MPAQTRASQVISERNRRNAKNPHHDTPKKVRVRTAVDMVKNTNIYGSHVSKEAIFMAAGVSSSAGYRMLTENLDSNRTFPHKDRDFWKETRGAPALVSGPQLIRMEAIIKAADIEEKSMTWDTLAMEAEVYNPEFNKDGSCSKKAGKPVSGRTIRRVMGTMDYHKCVACQRS